MLDFRRGKMDWPEGVEIVADEQCRELIQKEKEAIEKKAAKKKGGAAAGATASTYSYAAGADGFGDFGMGAYDFTTTFGGAPCVVVLCVAAALRLCLLYRSACASQPHDGIETLFDGVVVHAAVVVANLLMRTGGKGGWGVSDSEDEEEKVNDGGDGERAAYKSAEDFRTRAPDGTCADVLARTCVRVRVRAWVLFARALACERA